MRFSSSAFSTSTRWAFGFAALFGFALVGCDGGAKSGGAAKAVPVAKDAHGHDHAHDHAHDGPHGGHIAEVGKEDYHLEWTHDDDTGKVTIYVLDKDMKKEVPVPAEKLILATKSGEEAKDYEFAAVDAKEGKTAQFTVTDKSLLGVLEALSDKVTASIKEIEIEGKKFENVKLSLEHHHH